MPLTLPFSGVLTAIDMIIAGKVVATVFCAVCTLTVASCTLLSVIQIKNVYTHYKQGNHSVERASGEAARGAASNQVVKSAVRGAAGSLV